MATIAAVTTAPLVLRNTDASLSEITTWFKTWIGWGVHRKQDWALSQLALLYLDIDTPPAPSGRLRSLATAIARFSLSLSAHAPPASRPTPCSPPVVQPPSSFCRWYYNIKNTGPTTLLLL